MLAFTALQAGTVGPSDTGAEPIILSGGYADDEDYGDTIIYTGHGGRDPNSGRLIEETGPTRSTALDYANPNIHVNAICPRVIGTVMIDRISRLPRTATTVPSRRRRSAGRAGEEIASAVMWLRSADGAFTTGSAMIVDDDQTVGLGG